MDDITLTVSVSLHEHVFPFAVFQRRYTAPPNQAGVKLKSVIGYNGNGRGNMVWHPDSGTYVQKNSPKNFE